LTKLRLEFDDVPSWSGIYRALVRQRLIEPKARRRQRKDYKRWERSRSMELWQMDVVGRIILSDGTPLSAVTGIDDHSRFCVIAKLVTRATARPVCDALIEGFSCHGISESILTDNGRVFTAKASGTSSKVLFDRICHHNGVKHVLTAPYSPMTTGKIERLHRTMRREFFELHTFDTIEEAQAALDEWVISYNTEREHQSIGDVAPITRFELAATNSSPPFDVIDGEVPDAPAEPPARRVRRMVDLGGRIRVLGFRYHVGKEFSGCAVQVMNSGGLLNVTHNEVLWPLMPSVTSTTMTSPSRAVVVPSSPHHRPWGSRCCAASTHRASSASPESAIGVAPSTGVKKLVSESSAIPCRSRSRVAWSAPTGLVTTRLRSSGLWPSPPGKARSRRDGVA
jgi:transposase InsO family protein